MNVPLILSCFTVCNCHKFGVQYGKKKDMQYYMHSLSALQLGIKSCHPKYYYSNRDILRVTIFAEREPCKVSIPDVTERRTISNRKEHCSANCVFEAYRRHSLLHLSQSSGDMVMRSSQASCMHCGVTKLFMISAGGPLRSHQLQ